MRIRLSQLIIMLLALALSWLPAFRLDQVRERQTAELSASQASGETEFLPVNLECKIIHHSPRQCMALILSIPPCRRIGRRIYYFM